MSRNASTYRRHRVWTTGAGCRIRQAIVGASGIQVRHVTGGMGLLTGAADINLGWHAEPEPDRSATVNPLFLGQFGRKLAE